MPPFLLLLGRPPGADAGSAFLPTRCSCCHLGSTQLLEEVGETPQGAEGFATGPELCGGRPHPEGRVTGKLRFKNETRSPQPSARSRRWGSGGAGDGHAANAACARLQDGFRCLGGRPAHLSSHLLGQGAAQRRAAAAGGGHARGLSGTPWVTRDQSLASVWPADFSSLNRCGDSHPFPPDPEGGGRAASPSKPCDFAQVT